MPIRVDVDRLVTVRIATYNLAPFPTASVHVRGNEITIDGEEAELVGRLFDEMVLLRQRTEDAETSLERERRSAEKQFTDLLDAAPLMVWMSGTDAMGTFFNRLFPLFLSAQNINIIPQPQSFIKGEGQFVLNSNTMIGMNNNSMLPQANYLQTVLHLI